MLNELYQELILQHAKGSRMRGVLRGERVVATEVHNPLCGDQLTITGQFDGDKLTAIRFEGSGCAISQAAASMLAELAEGKNEGELATLIESFRELVRNGEEACDHSGLGDLKALRGVRKFPIRVKCALLACEGLSKLLEASKRSS